MAQAITPSKTAINTRASHLSRRKSSLGTSSQWSRQCDRWRAGLSPQPLRPFYQAVLGHDYFPARRQTGKADLGIASTMVL